MVPVDLLASFLPRTAREALAQGRTEVGLDVVALSADISGYTELAETLAAQGASGPEELSAVINRALGRLVELVAQHGGDVVKFAGDALLAVWEVGSDGPQRPLQLAAGLGQLLPMEQAGPEGIARLRVGLGMGRLLLVLPLDERGRAEVLVLGSALASATQAERQAQPGEVVVSPEAWLTLGSCARGRPLAEGGAVLEGLVEGAPTAPLPPAATDPTLAPRLEPFVPLAVLSRLRAGQSGWLAELRTVSALFIGVPTISVAQPPPIDSLRELSATLQRTLDQHEGVLDKFTVDDKGLCALAVFGLPPLTHEDDAWRAVRAALALRAALEPWQARIGIATGRVFCGTIGRPGRLEYTVIGGTVNRAARLMAAAPPEGVLCDEATTQGAGERVAWVEVPPVRARGIRLPIAAFRPERMAQGGRISLDALVGREAELANLRAGLEATRDGAAARVVLVTGATGMGVSALLAQTEQTARDLGLRVFSATADPVERLTPYHAWRPVIREVLGRENVVARLAMAVPPALQPLTGLLQDILPLGLPERPELAALSPEQRGERTRELLVALLQAASRAAAVVVLDDAQWLDSASWALVEAVVERVPRLHLILGARPPEGDRVAATARLLAHPRVEALPLRPLGDAQMMALATAALGLRTVPSAAAHALLSRAQGNPFFLLELARTLREAAQDAPSWETHAPTTLPNSIEAVVLARIDRLPPEEQLLLRVASVIGRSFHLTELQLLHPNPDPEALQRNLHALERAGLLRQAPGPPGAEDLWSFTGAVVRDAAYGLLTFAQRKGLHRALGVALDARAAAGDHVDLPVLAWHWTRAEDIPRAIAALDAAGEAASRQFALDEMNRFYRKALALAPDAPQAQRTRWLMRLGVSRLRVGLPSEARDFLLQSLALRGSVPGQGRLALLQMIGVQALRRSLGRSPPRLDAAQAEAARQDARVWLELGWTSYFRLEPVPALVSVLRAANFAEAVGPSYELAVAYASLCTYATLAGLEGVARRYLALADQTLAATEDPAAHGASRGVLGAGLLARARWKEADQTLHEARSHQEEAGLFEDRDLSYVLLGLSALMQGDLDTARACAETATRGGDRRGSPIVQVRSRFLLGTTRFGAGVFDEAADAWGGALELAERAGEGLDPTSRIAAGAGGALAALLKGTPQRAAKLLDPVLRDPKLIPAVTAPSNRIGLVLGLALLTLHRQDPAPRWREALQRLARDLGRRARILQIHAPVAALLGGHARAAAGDALGASRRWTEGRAQAATMGAPWDEAALAMSLGVERAHLGFETLGARADALGPLLGPRSER